MFAVLLPMVPFVLWHDELIFNHSEEEWAYFFPVPWLTLPHALAGLTALLTGAFSVLVSYFRLLLMSVPELSANQRVPASTYLRGFPVLYRLVTCSFFRFSEGAHGLFLCLPKTPSDSSRAGSARM